MKKGLAGKLCLSFAALLVAACATPRAGDASSLGNTYVFVFTVPASVGAAAMKYHCTPDCNQTDWGDKYTIFHVEDLGYVPERKFDELMLSTNWHEPDLATARRWGQCTVANVEKEIGWKVTSAYLIEVLSPVDPHTGAARKAPKQDPCSFRLNAHKKDQ